MKKNFLKYLLLGVFSLSLGAGFVGCKDYDDDIDDLWGAIEDVKKQLSDLSGSTVKEISYNEGTGVMTVTMADNTTKTLNLKQDMVTYTVSTSISGDELTVTITGSDGSSSSDKVTLPTSDGSGSPDPVDGFDPSKLVIKDGKIYYGDEPTGVTLPVEYAGDSYIVALTDGDGAFIGYQVVYDGTPYDFYIADALPLTSIVFIPQSYLSGVEAMRSTSYDYRQWSRTTADPNGERGEIWNGGRNVAISTVSNQIIAQYHVNPSSVTKEQIKALDVLSDDKEFYGTRAADSKPRIADFDKDVTVDDGIMTVKFTVDAEFIRNMVADEITVLAVQATVDHEGKEKTVTSDYAAVYRSIVQDFTLALTDKPETNHSDSLNQRHLYGADETTNGIDSTYYPNQGPFNGDLRGYAQVAIDSDYDYQLLYTDTFDLKDVLAVHYRERLDDGTTNVSAEKSTLNPAEFGLSYKFTKSGYEQGSNKTNQADFIQVTADGIVSVDVYGEQITGIAAVGREPMIRVELIEDASGKTINAGWVKFLIVEDASGSTANFDMGTIMVNCTNADLLTTNRQINLQLYEKIGLYKTAFYNVYDTFVPSIAANVNDLGTVTELPDPDDNETILLNWEITPAEMELALADGRDSIRRTVIYRSSTGARNDVVINFAVKVVEPEATIDSHNSTYWNTALNEIYVNAEIPGSHSNLDDFWTDMDWVFKVPTGETDSRPNFNITPASALTDYPADYVWNYNNTNNLNYFYQFREGYTATEKVGNVDYAISVNNTQVNRAATAANQSYSYLLATRGSETQIVATIDTYTGIVEYYNGEITVTGGGANPNFTLTSNINPVTLAQPNSFVSNMSNSFAKLLLNRVEARQSGMMSAEVEVILYNTCRDIKVTNGVFTAFFFRPVNVAAGTGNDFSDSTIQEIDLTELAILTDWRKAYGSMWTGTSSFINTLIQANSQTWNSKTYHTFFEYYDVTSITVDIAGITTTMDGGTLGTTGINPQLGVENVAPTGGIVQGPALADVDYGVFRYTNNGSKTQTPFQMRLPVVVTYKWGQVTVDVDVTVTP